MGAQSLDSVVAEPLPENLFDDGLSLLFADNFRQRRALSLLRVAAAGGALSGPVLGALSKFLREDMLLHILDEEDMFPVLRIRCTPADRLDGLLAEAATQHRKERDAIAEIAARARPYATAAIIAAPFSAGMRRLVSSFVRLMKDHILNENVLLLPLARRRLLTSDNSQLGRSMSARRVSLGLGL